MGYLDNSTNNVILDAVLTDYGRQQLASANNAFSITYYALGDDEVDYRLINKYGRAVGKEKIEKNTPIFEALTNPSIALKYRLIGRENDGTSIQTPYLPVLKSTSSIALGINGGGTTGASTVRSIQASIVTYFNNNTGTAIPPELIQRSYLIKVPDRFFTIDTAINGKLTQPDIARTSVDSGDPNRVATYRFTTTTSVTTIAFSVTARNIDNTVLSIYGKRASGNYRTINSYITVVGEQHGCTVDIPVTYTAQTV
jgi:hypothetical protein